MRVAFWGLVLEAGCLWIWAISPTLTAGYNAEFTARFFERIALPRIDVPIDGGDVYAMVAALEIGFALMTAGYLGGLFTLRRVGTINAGPARAVVGAAVVYRITMCLLPGLFSTDIYSYAMYGRIAAVYHQNPYVQPPSHFPGDAFLGWVFPFWRDQPTVYGPLWTDFSWLLSSLTAGMGNFEQVMAYRVFLAAVELAVLVLLWWLLGRTLQSEEAGARTLAFAVYAWNPLVLFDLVGSSHNDVLMLALLLCGVGLMYVRNGWLGGGLAVVLSALVKVATGLALLVFAVAWAAPASGWRDRLRRVVAFLAVVLALTMVVAWPWLYAPEALSALANAAGGKLVVNSAPDLAALTIADQVLVPAGMEVETAQAAARFWVRAATRVGFVGYLAWELWRLWRFATLTRAARHLSQRERWMATAVAVRALLVLPLVVLTWVWSWYFSWSFVLASLLGPTSRLCRVVVAYTLVALPVVYAHQYLNEQLAGAFVLILALLPLAAALEKIPNWDVTYNSKEGSGALNMRTLPPTWGITLVRVVAGIILIVAALEKYAGGGFDGFTRATTSMGIPLPQFWGIFIPLLELIGGALLLVGLGARWVALLFVCEFLVTTFALKAPRQPPFGGWDSMRIDLMLLATAVMIVLVGPGAFALDSWLMRTRGRASLSESAASA